MNVEHTDELSHESAPKEEPSNSEPVYSHEVNNDHCPVCGCKIDNNANFCSGCGAKIKVSNVKERNLSRLKLLIDKYGSLNKKKKIQIVLILAVAVIVFISGMLPSSIERSTIDDAKELKSMMKNPDSFAIHGDVVVLSSSYKNGEKYTITLIDHSSENGFGGTGREQAIFRNGEYLGDYSDSSGIDLISAKLTLNTADSKDFTYIDGKMVAKKVGADYYD